MAIGFIIATVGSLFILFLPKILLHLQGAEVDENFQIQQKDSSGKTSGIGSKILHVSEQNPFFPAMKRRISDDGSSHSNPIGRKYSKDDGLQRMSSIDSTVGDKKKAYQADKRISFRKDDLLCKMSDIEETEQA